jgi:hypothetical protein
MADNVGSQIIGELGEIGKKIGGEIAKLPKDVAGKAMESVGGPSATGKGAAVSPLVSHEGSSGKSAWERIDSEKDKKIRRAMARKALEELSSRQLQQREPSVWERLQQEQDQKKRQGVANQQAAASQLAPSSAKRPRGDLYGAKAKKTATENRNVRQD